MVGKTVNCGPSTKFPPILLYKAPQFEGIVLEIALHEAC